MPQIHLPLKKLKARCPLCGTLAHLRLCDQCAEKAYCSTECQKDDWSMHKKTCETDRIDLSSFYPLIACVIDGLHFQRSVGHPALTHKIINAPNPYTPASRLPGGTYARAVALGSSIGQEAYGFSDKKVWWPKGHTAFIRSQLMLRIVREGHVLPIVISTCISLILSLYTTTTTEEEQSATTEPRRVRLRYRSFPISDIGVVAGSVCVLPTNRLAYILPDGTTQKGQNPDDHYWIYFRTVRGEEVFLDCCLFTFNLSTVIPADPYPPARAAGTFMPTVPAFFKDRIMTRDLLRAGQPRGVNLHKERRRFSVLRNDTLRVGMEQIYVDAQGAVVLTRESKRLLHEFMNTVGGRPVGDKAVDNCIESIGYGVNVIMDAAVLTSAWKTYPEQPLNVWHGDPVL